MVTSSKCWSDRRKQNESEKVVGIDLTCSCKFPNSLPLSPILSHSHQTLLTWMRECSSSFWSKSTHFRPTRHHFTSFSPLRIMRSRIFTTNELDWWRNGQEQGWTHRVTDEKGIICWKDPLDAFLWVSSFLPSLLHNSWPSSLPHRPFPFTSSAIFRPFHPHLTVKLFPRLCSFQC